MGISNTSLSSGKAVPPPPAEIEATDSAASTVSLVDVDTPSVRTVPSDFADQDVTTETEAARLDRELDLEKQRAALDKANSKGKGKSKSSSAKDKAFETSSAAAAKAARAKAKAADKLTGAEHAAEDGARRADRWLTRQFAALEEDHPQAARLLAAGNLAAVVGLGALLGYRAWGLHERGQLSWKSAAWGLGVLGAVGLVEGMLASYFYRAKDKKQ